MSQRFSHRSRRRDLAAGAVILVWMLLFSMLTLKNHHAVTRISAEASAAAMRVDALEGQIATLERLIAGPADVDASSNDAQRDPVQVPAGRRMK